MRMSNVCGRRKSIKYDKIKDFLYFYKADWCILYDDVDFRM